MSNIKDQFIENAIEHSNAIQKGDYKAANKMHAKLSNLYNRIKKEDNWGEELKHLSEHSNESVKLWAATFLLKHDSESGLKVLNELTNSQTIIGLTASTTIDMWKKGMLEL